MRNVNAFLKFACDEEDERYAEDWNALRCLPRT
jgi:hypothetical protein